VKPIVFLHIPKTAGQTIHKALADAVGQDNVSPIRVHGQVKPGMAQFPPGYLLYSGHIDWTDLETVPSPRFVFTVLRDPRERIASFYFYMLDQAAGVDPADLDLPQRTGMRMIRTRSADDYFFGGDARWQRFIYDHYDNFYCSYFATRRMRGSRLIAKLPPDRLLDRAYAQSSTLDRIYATTDLAALEADIATEWGARIQVADRYINAGPDGRGQARWPRLIARMERDDSAARLARFADLDRRLMERLGL
jgi:Sulfotransferase family